LLYYFQGCSSWEWYYPYHYAPFAADFVGIADIKISFDKGRIFKPFEQLMGVLPAASKHAIPKVFHELMTDQDSEIIDFYPEEFPIDLNGKKFAWQGVALLPWIDARRLLEAMEKLYPMLPPEEAARNVVGRDVLLVSHANEKFYDEIMNNFYSKRQGPPTYKLNPRISDGLAGNVEKDETYLPHGSLTYPLTTGARPNLDEDRCISVHYDFPHSNHVHKSMLLRGVHLPPRVLDQIDIEATKGRAARSGRGQGGVPLRNENANRGRESFNYGPSSATSGGQVNQYQQSYGNPNDPRTYQYAPPPQPTWQPPPPGMNGFARGPPPPPPGMYSSSVQVPSYQGYVPPPPAHFTPPYPQHPSGNGQAYHRRDNGNPGGGRSYGSSNGYDRYR